MDVLVCWGMGDGLGLGTLGMSRLGQRLGHGRSLAS